MGACGARHDKDREAQNAEAYGGLPAAGPFILAPLEEKRKPEEVEVKGVEPPLQGPGKPERAPHLPASPKEEGKEG